MRLYHTNACPQATTKFKKTGETLQQLSSFLGCAACGVVAKRINDAKVGSKLFVDGELKQQKWEDKVTGQKRSRVEITVNDVTVYGEPSAGKGEGEYEFETEKNETTL